MLVLVVIMFGVCWLPLHTFFLVIDFNPQLMVNQTESQERIFTVVFYSAFWLAMSNSCANPIIYGFTNDSFRTDLASLCYRRFPCCLCLRKMANRQLSMSTCDTAYNKRFNTFTKKGQNSARLCRQSGYRNGSKVYIELRGDPARGRNQARMNEFYKDNSETAAAAPLTNGRLANSHNHNHNYNHDHHGKLNREQNHDRHSVNHLNSQNHNHYHHPHHHHHHELRRQLFRKDSAESTKSLTSRNNNDLFSNSPNNCHDERSSTYPGDTEFSFTKMEESTCLRLNTLPEMESSDCSNTSDFNTI